MPTILIPGDSSAFDYLDSRPIERELELKSRQEEEAEEDRGLDQTLY